MPGDELFEGDAAELDALTDSLAWQSERGQRPDAVGHAQLGTLDGAPACAR